MPRIFNYATAFILSLAAVSFMYQEAPAQKKKTAPQAVRNAAAASPTIAYTVSMSEPWTHLLEVEMDLAFDRAMPTVEVKMPVWTPGSYLVREYARHVQDFAVRSDGGRELKWRKINKNTWQIDAGDARAMKITYKVYSNELTVRTNELNDEHAFWNNAALLMFPKDQLAAPSTITVRPHGNWKIATGLPAVSGSSTTFRAANFDVLYDSPFEVSDFKETSFDVRGKRHRLVFTGEGNYDMAKTAADIAKIAEEGYEIFGELPFDDYTFIVNLRGGGGLEHMNSTALQWNRFGFKPQARYNDFLALVAHEYFHLWNVKRIRPDALGPFDYENENYTRLLWVAEGATAYYEGVLLRRAGLISDKQFLAARASTISQLQARPGRFETSLEEASFDAWIKYYRQDENSVNNQISYYDKGEIVNMMLDIAIRTASDGKRSLDDVFRDLYQNYFKKGRNFTPEDYQKAAEAAAGKSLDDFFAKYVRGTDEIDYDGLLAGIGLRMNASPVSPSGGYIGADLAEEGGRLTIRSIPSNTPAYQYGLNTGDQIVAIDGNRASQNFLQSYLAERKAGDRVRLTIFRFDRLREIEFTLGKNMRQDHEFVRVASPTDKQKRLYKDYLQADLK